MKEPRLTRLVNGTCVPLEELAPLTLDALREAITAAVRAGLRLVAMFGAAQSGGVFLYAVVADDLGGDLLAGRAPLPAGGYPAFTPQCTQAHWFEREIAEQYGVRPEGHPWLKPIRFERPLAGDTEPPRIGVTDFFRVRGEEIHEVAVGPVHAGVIEPGHFRFQCHGEDVFHLEISLGYQHRGIERMLVGGPHRATGVQLETVAGDTTIGHMTAYAQLCEALGGTQISARAMAIRGIALELERLANHTGDLGALSGDVAFLPTASFCGRLRGDFLNLSAELCGSRFGRGLVVPGGVGFDIEDDQLPVLRERLERAFADVAEAADVLFETSSVQSRFEGIGSLGLETAREIGLVGPAARACGLTLDVRRDHPAGIYQFAYLPVITGSTGDVNARAYVRRREIEKSVQFIREQLAMLPQGELRVPVGAPAPNVLALTMTEGWRGEICHVALTDAAGKFLRYKIIDPSFHNWFGLALAVRNQQISDFPLINKSFNLSYCGHDL
jgi:Ni,Fe-hydrogenase III large subunit